MSDFEILDWFVDLLSEALSEDEAIDREAALAAEMADYFHLGYSQF